MSHVCSKGWGARCPASKGPRCKCRCGGHNHGNPKARPKQEGDESSERMERTPDSVLFYSGDEEPVRLPDDELRAPDQRIIHFARKPRDLAFPSAIDPGDPVVLLGDAPLARTLCHHSPDGFEFGYGGSGPADLALNILALVVSPKEAWHLHQQFKWDFIARAKAGDLLPLSNVREWVAGFYAAERAGDLAYGAVSG